MGLGVRTSLDANMGGETDCCVTLCSLVLCFHCKAMQVHRACEKHHAEKAAKGHHGAPVDQEMSR